MPVESESANAKREHAVFHESDIENINLLHEIGIEAEKIYTHIRKEIGVTDKKLDSRGDRKKAALLYFQDHEDQFHHIDEKHIEDLYIYDFKSSQSKRDFMSRLLKSVFNGKYPHLRLSGIQLVVLT